MNHSLTYFLSYPHLEMLSHLKTIRQIIIVITDKIFLTSFTHFSLKSSLLRGVSVYAKPENFLMVGTLEQFLTNTNDIKLI